MMMNHTDEEKGEEKENLKNYIYKIQKPHVFHHSLTASNTRKKKSFLSKLFNKHLKQKKSQHV